MNALVAFVVAPAAVAFLRGRPIFWHSLAALVVLFLFLQGATGVAAALWLAELGLAFLL
jgi:hypothetical protein